MGNAGYRQIHPELWDDPFILDLAPEEKLLFIYMFSNSRSSLCGLYEISIKQIVFHTGLEEKYIISTIKKFEQAGKIVGDENIYFVVNQFKRHFSRSPKVIERVNNDIESTRDCKPKTVCIQKYEELYGYRYPIHIVSGKAVYSMDTQTYKIREDNIKEDNDKTKTPTDKKIPVEQTQQLIDFFIEQTNLQPVNNKMFTSRWVTPIREMLKVSGNDIVRTKEVMALTIKDCDKTGWDFSTPYQIQSRFNGIAAKQGRKKPAGTEFDPNEVL